MEIRKRDGKYSQVQMGCKSAEACTNERNQNFHGNRPGNYQCKFDENRGPSVCRQCCKNKNLCTGQNVPTFWIPTTKWQWSTDIK